MVWMLGSAIIGTHLAGSGTDAHGRRAGGPGSMRLWSGSAGLWPGRVDCQSTVARSAGFQKSGRLTVDSTKGKRRQGQAQANQPQVHRVRKGQVQRNANRGRSSRASTSTARNAP
ncbi:hypothetical protein SM139_3052 [Stenotrophomonas maltophilia]|nr:hypothetical protein SM139_3052 [Stenotrophomonas maltophilia]